MEFFVHYIIAGNIGGKTVIVAENAAEAADIFNHTCFGIYKVVKVETKNQTGVKNHV